MKYNLQSLFVIIISCIILINIFVWSKVIHFINRIETPSYYNIVIQPASDNASALIKHSTVKATGGQFRSIEGYLIDGPSNPIGFSNDNGELVLVLLGYGHFGKRNDDIPTLKCVFGDITVDARVHVNGTAFQRKLSPSGRMLYRNERNVMITCNLGVHDSGYTSNSTLQQRHGSIAGNVRIMSVDDNNSFDTGYVIVRRFMSDNTPEQQYDMVQCSAPIHHINGTKWLIEWIEYHIVIGFQHIHLYICDGLDEIQPMLNIYISKGFITVHDWSDLGDSPRVGVKIENFEHAQRAARNDCYFRNRGVAKYIAFSDIDELWSPGTSGTSDVISGDDRWRYKPGKILPTQQWMSWFEKQHALNKNHIGFIFKSITTPPLDSFGILKQEKAVASSSFDAWGHEIILDQHSDTNNIFMDKIQIAESHCEEPYNCGLYHRGRQKYMIRTAKGSVFVNDVLFYHAVNENYEEVADHLMVQVPLELGYIRHLAGHFKHSRKGGLLVNNRIHLPIHPVILNDVRNRIFEDPKINGMYMSSPIETMLKLDHFSDAWRFVSNKDIESTYSEDERHAYKMDELLESSVAIAQRDTQFITFEQFGGRLNNQLLTLDWVFRLSLAFHRTLYLPTNVKKEEHWIGLPENKLEEDMGSSLWDFTRLRKRFNFITTYDLEIPSLNQYSYPLRQSPDNIDPKCVWSYKLVEKHPEWKNLVTWAGWASQQLECKTRIHFTTSDGLVHAYRTDTRRLGVGPFVFWNAMTPAIRLHRTVDEFLSKYPHRTSIGIHSRSHNSYGPGNIQRAMQSCKRLIERPLKHAKTYLQTRRRCCDTIQTSDVDVDVDVDVLFKERLLLDMCNITSNVMDLAIDLAGGEKLSQFILASDHENSAVDKMVYDTYSGISFDGYTGITPNEKKTLSNPSWRRNIQEVLLDILILIKTDVFFGNPGSTLTQSVCMWRNAHSQKGMIIESSNACGLILLSTGANTCDSIEC